MLRAYPTDDPRWELEPHWESLQAAGQEVYTLALQGVIRGSLLGMTTSALNWAANRLLLTYGVSEMYKALMGIWPVDSVKLTEEQQHLVSADGGLEHAVRYNELFRDTKEERADAFQMALEDPALVTQLTPGEIRMIANANGLTAEQTIEAVKLSKDIPQLHVVEIDEISQGKGGGLWLLALVLLVLIGMRRA